MKLLVLVGCIVVALSAHAQSSSSGHGAPTFNCAANDTYKDVDSALVWQCNTPPTGWVPTPAYIPWGTPAITLIAIAPQTALAANATMYFAPIGVVNLGTSAVIREIAFPRSGTIANLYVCTGNAQPATGSFVFTIQTGAWQGTLTNSPLSVSIAASSPAGCYQDATHSTTYTAGQAIAIQAINNATASNSAVFQSVYVEFTGAH